MIVDLNLKGKEVVVFGGGGEATRKVETLLTQPCKIIVVAEEVSEKIQGWVQKKKIVWKSRRIDDGNCLREFDRLILVIAATDDRSLNREILQTAKALRCYAYAVDDPEHSDFSHPAVFNFDDTVQIAISTGGKSPLIARKIRERAQSVFNDLIQKEDLMQIRLQERIREVAKNTITTPDRRKRFLEAVSQDPKIKQLLSRERLEEAEKAALELMVHFRQPDKNHP